MIIIPGRKAGAVTELRGSTFTGPVWADPVLPTSDGVTINTVHFPPGSRTFWHSHERGQILQVISGSGLVCTDGQSPHRLRPGDIVHVPAGERHWHGGSPDSFMAHVAISLGTTEWAEEVTPDAYTATPDE